MLAVYMERPAAEFALSILQRADITCAESREAEAAIVAALATASRVDNPHKDFGLPAATDAEASASIK
jgi:hypothetical protein